LDPYPVIRMNSWASVYNNHYAQFTNPATFTCVNLKLKTTLLHPHSIIYNNFAVVQLTRQRSNMFKLWLEILQFSAALKAFSKAVQIWQNSHQISALKHGVPATELQRSRDVPRRLQSKTCLVGDNDAVDWRPTTTTSSDGTDDDGSSSSSSSSSLSHTQTMFLTSSTQTHSITSQQSDTWKI